MKPKISKLVTLAAALIVVLSAPACTSVQSLLVTAGKNPQRTMQRQAERGFYSWGFAQRQDTLTKMYALGEIDKEVYDAEEAKLDKEREALKRAQEKQRKAHPQNAPERSSSSL